MLNGYTVVSLVAAPNSPSTLYACAVQSQSASNSGQSASYTILRSIDFGSNWQNIGSSAALGGNCELAINPSNSNDLYVVGLTNAKPAHDILKHSIDGGQTWTAISPTLHLAGTQSTIPWNVQQISIQGNRMFGLQWMPIGALPANREVEPADVLSERLATSIDNGQTWTVIDGQFIAQRLGAHSYAVDPGNPNTIYDLLGGSFIPPVVKPIPTNDVLPAYSLNGELFKTTDGGANWHLLRKDLTFGTQIQLAHNKPNIIYVGGFIGHYPLPAESTSTDNPAQTASYPGYAGFFHLSMSDNAGASWRDIAIPTDSWAIRNWVVSQDGQVYLSPAVTFNGTTGSAASGSPATAIVATAVATVVPGKKGIIPPTAPQTGAGSPPTNTNQPPTPNVPPPAGTVVVPTVPPQSQAIQRYDPNTNKWSKLTNPPASWHPTDLNTHRHEWRRDTVVLRPQQWK